METITQEDIKDCGLVTIQYLFNYYYHHKLDLYNLKHEAHYGVKGISVYELKRLAKNYALDFQAYRGAFDDLKKMNWEQPIITLVQKDGIEHYVILRKMSAKYVYYFDPFLGEIKDSKKAFENIYQNLIIIATQIPSLVNSKLYKKERRAILSDFKWNKGNLGILLLTFSTNLLSFALAFFMKLIFDKVIPNEDKFLAFYISAIFLLATLLKLLLETWKDFIVSYWEQQLFEKLSKRFYLKIVSLQNNQFEKLKYEDYLRRDALMQQISSFKAKFSYALFSEIITFLLAGTLLVWLNYKLFLITLIASSLMMLISLIYQSQNLKNYQKIIPLSLRLNSANYDLILGKKQTLFPKVAHYLLQKRLRAYHNLVLQEWRFYKQSAFKNFLSSLLSGTSPIVLVCLGVFSFFDKEISIGTLLLFLMAFNFFQSPLLSFSELIVKKPLYNKNLDLLNYVFAMKNFEIKNIGVKLDNIKSISFYDYKFWYEPDKVIVSLSNYSIDKHLRLQGTNGSGKSSLLKSLLGTYQYQGIIKFNDIDFKFLNQSELIIKTFYLSPENYLFSGKIIDYLCNQDSQLLATFEANLLTYRLDKLLQKLRLSLDGEIYNNGSTLSSGQKQILWLLKLFTQKYHLILLDEAFENIDHEKRLFLQKAILDYQDKALIIEISHSGFYLTNEQVLNLDQTF